MSVEKHILRDLLAGPSTASSIAGRVDLHPAAVTSILARQQKSGEVASRPLACLTVWTLTEKTRQALCTA
jgi:hypothetical protein